MPGTLLGTEGKAKNQKDMTSALIKLKVNNMPKINSLKHGEIT